jgi:hypothetical protein
MVRFSALLFFNPSVQLDEDHSALFHDTASRAFEQKAEEVFVGELSLVRPGLHSFLEHDRYFLELGLIQFCTVVKRVA